MLNSTIFNNPVDGAIFVPLITNFDGAPFAQWTSKIWFSRLFASFRLVNFFFLHIWPSLIFFGLRKPRLQKLRSLALIIVFKLLRSQLLTIFLCVFFYLLYWMTKSCLSCSVLAWEEFEIVQVEKDVSDGVCESLIALAKPFSLSTAFSTSTLSIEIYILSHPSCSGWPRVP